MKHIGYYGKTQHRGDFVRHNLPAAFVSVWDDWMQELLLAGQEQFGQNWPTVFESGPTWRFVLSSGVAGNEGWAGIMRPGHDKVRRRFPFCIAAALPDHCTPVIAYQMLGPWYRAVEHCLDDMHSSGYEFGELQAQLATLTEQHSTQFEQLPSVTIRTGISSPDDAFAVFCNRTDALHSPSAAAAFLDATLTQNFHQYSLWCTGSRASTSNGTLICSGLPSGSIGLGLFDQDWAANGAGQLSFSADPALELPIDVMATPVAADPVLDSEPTVAEEQELLSTGDWTALEEGLLTPLDPPPTPSIEPLEIEEDTSTKAPWEI